MNLTSRKTIVVAGAGFAGAAFSAIFGEWSSDLQALIVLMCIDFITGLMVAGLFQKSPKTFSGGLSSKECVKGIAKKTGELMLVAAAYQSEILLSESYSIPIRAYVISALCAAEIISIMENAGAMDILPESVQKIFRKVIDALNKKSGDDDKEGE